MLCIFVVSIACVGTHPTGTVYIPLYTCEVCVYMMPSHKFARLIFILKRVFPLSSEMLQDRFLGGFNALDIL